jgi:nucleoside-diphosphate-sugar epimerase
MKAKALLMLLFLPAAAWPQFGDIAKDVPHIIVEGTATVARLARLAGVRRLVYVSSIHALARPPRGTP